MNYSWRMRLISSRNATLIIQISPSWVRRWPRKDIQNWKENLYTPNNRNGWTWSLQIRATQVKRNVWRQGSTMENINSFIKNVGITLSKPSTSLLSTKAKNIPIVWRQKTNWQNLIMTILYSNRQNRRLLKLLRGLWLRNIQKEPRAIFFWPK